MTNEQLTSQFAAQMAKWLASQNSNKPAAKPVHKPRKASRSSNAQPFKKSIDNGLTERQIRNDSAVIRHYARLGISVRPRIDVMSYNMWLKAGRRVVGGQKATKVKGVGPMFHVSQTAPEVKVTKAELRDLGNAAVALQHTDLDAIIAQLGDSAYTG